MTTDVTLHRSIPTSATQGVSIEIRRVLPAGWTLSEDGDSFLVRGVLSAHCGDEVWKVARFVSYGAFHCLQRTLKTEAEVRYELLSDNGNGLGFRIEFLLTDARDRTSVE